MANQPTKYKKFLAGAASATLVATAIVPTALAADATTAATDFSDVAATHTHYAAIMQAVERGLFKGHLDGTFKPEASIDRKGVAKALANYVVAQSKYKTYEEYITANKLAETVVPFTDVPATHGDAELFNASLIVKDAGIFTGSNNNLMPNKVISRQQMAKVLVNGFGLKDLAGVESKVTDTDKAQAEFVNFINILSENGVTEVTAYNPTSDVKRGQMASFLNRSFDAAHPVATTPEVVSVSANNLKEIAVTFNKELNTTDAEYLANYKLTTVTTGGAATLVSATLSEDNKTVILSLGTEAKNQETYKLEVRNVKDTAGISVTTTEKEVKFFDVTAPTVSDVTLVGPRSVQVKFSEPLKTAPSFKLDNGAISTTVALSTDRKTATVEFGIAPTIGKHDLEIQGGSDYANLLVEKVVKNFDYQIDTTAPTVTVQKADVTSITLKFSKPVSVKTASSVSVYHTVNNSVPYAGSLTAVNPINGYSDTYTVAFGTPIAEGSTKVFLNTKENALEDGWGNDVASTELTASVVVDKIAPVVSGIEATADDEFEITFNKEVVAADVKKLSNYILKDGTGKVLTNDDYNFLNSKGEFLNSVSVSYDKKVATISLPSSLKGGNYTLTVKEIKDTTFLGNKLITQDISFAVTDTTAWNINGDAKFSSDNKKIRVNFNEGMSAEGLTDLSKYEIRTAAGVKVDFPAKTKVVVLNANTVEIQLGEAVSLSGNKLRVSGTLKDASNNNYTELYKEVNLTADAGPALVADTAKVTATDKVVFKVDQELKGSLNQTHFTTTGGITFGNASYVNKDGKSTVTLTVNSDTKFAVNATPTITVAANALESIFGSNNTGSITVNATDGIAPSVAKNSDDSLKIAKVTGTDQFTIEFNESVATSTASLLATDLVITDDKGKTLVAGVDYVATVSTNVITVDPTNDYNGLDKEYTVASVSTPVYIKDTTGNTANKFAATTVKVTPVADGATADQVAADAVKSAITAATTKAQIEAARASYTGLTTAQKALVTNEAALQTKEQGLVDAVILAVTATYAAADAGDTVVVDPQTGYTYAITGSSAVGVIDNAGVIVTNGTATLTYTVTHTSSGKTATKTVSVTVAP